jgi:hypothetical protein
MQMKKSHMQQKTRATFGGGTSSSFDLFRGVASCKVGDGTIVLFWPNVVFSARFP